MMREWTFGAASLLVLALAGCKGEDTDETDPPLDSDGDGVVDEDDCKPNDADIYPGAPETPNDGVDSDCDGEDPVVEVPVDYGDFAGTLDYKYSTDKDGVVCDAQFALTGETFVGDCLDCDYAFRMDSEIVAGTDKSTEDCVYNPLYTFTEGGIVANPVMAFVPTYAGTYEDYTNLFLVGYDKDYTAYGYGVYEGPYWSALHIDGNENSTFTQTGNDLAWTLVDSGSLGIGGWGYDGCEEVVQPPVDDDGVEVNDSFAKAKTQEIAESFACDTSTADVYTFTGSGGKILVSADNADAATAMDLRLLVVGPDECIGWAADDSLTCAFSPTTSDPRYQCPAMEIASITGAKYEVFVTHWGGCGKDVTTEGDGNYVFGIDGATATLASDDFSLGFDVDVKMTGKITPPAN